MTARSPFQVTQGQGRLEGHLRKHGDHRGVARQAARRFADQLRQRQTVGQLHAGQGFQDTLELFRSTPCRNDQGLQAIALFDHRRTFPGLLARTIIGSPTFLADAISRVATIGDEAHLLAKLDRRRDASDATVVTASSERNGSPC